MPREGPNPLRPYYIPPSIGTAAENIPNSTSAKAAGPAPSNFTFPDVDVSDYLPEGSPSFGGSLKSLFDKGLWRYTSILMAQPFEVAKIILQVHVAQDGEDYDLNSRRINRGSDVDYEEEAEEKHVDSDDDEPNFFTSTTPYDQLSSSASPPRGRQGRPLRSPQQQSKKPDNHITGPNLS